MDIVEGFSSPTLTKLLIRNPPATFLWKVDGNSMRDAGIFHGDLIVVAGTAVSG